MSAEPPAAASEPDSDDPSGTRYFDGFTLVEPGLVAPAQWRPDLDNPLRGDRDPDGDGDPVLRLISPEDRGVGWHLCGSASRTSPDSPSPAHPLNFER
jgi:hypothetical protein